MQQVPGWDISVGKGCLSSRPYNCLYVRPSVCISFVLVFQAKVPSDEDDDTADMEFQCRLYLRIWLTSMT